MCSRRSTSSFILIAVGHPCCRHPSSFASVWPSLTTHSHPGLRCQASASEGGRHVTVMGALSARSSSQLAIQDRGQRASAVHAGGLPRSHLRPVPE